MTIVFRWFLVLAAPIFGWHLALVTGLVLLSFVERLCPPEAMISGLCTASWFPFAEKAVFCFSTALAAFFIVAGSVLSAPSWRCQIAWAVFVLGSAVALAMAVAASAWAEFGSAVIAGGVTSFVLARRFGAGVAHTGFWASLGRR